jgi:chromosome transmission fidelity protein 18
MASLELRFVQERADDGQLAYRLDPYVRLDDRTCDIFIIFLFFKRPVDVFVTYDGKRAADIAVSRYAVRHLVAGEVS